MELGCRTEEVHVIIFGKVLQVAAHCEGSDLAPDNSGQVKREAPGAYCWEQGTTCLMAIEMERSRYESLGWWWLHMRGSHHARVL